MKKKSKIQVILLIFGFTIFTIFPEPTEGQLLRGFIVKRRKVANLRRFLSQNPAYGFRLFQPTFPQVFLSHQLYRAAHHYSQFGNGEAEEISGPGDLGTLLWYGVQPFVAYRQFQLGNFQQASSGQTAGNNGLGGLAGTVGTSGLGNWPNGSPQGLGLNGQGLTQHPQFFPSPEISSGLEPTTAAGLTHSDVNVIAAFLPPGTLPTNPTSADLARAFNNLPPQNAFWLARNLPKDILDRVFEEEKIQNERNGGVITPETPIPEKPKSEREDIQQELDLIAKTVEEARTENTAENPNWNLAKEPDTFEMFDEILRLRSSRFANKKLLERSRMDMVRPEFLSRPSDLLVKVTK